RRQCQHIMVHGWELLWGALGSIKQEIPLEPTLVTVVAGGFERSEQIQRAVRGVLVPFLPGLAKLRYVLSLDYVLPQAMFAYLQSVAFLLVTSVQDFVPSDATR